MNKILITGGSGFIGTNMVEYYIDQSFSILNLDIAPPLDEKQLKYWSKCDINNKDDLINQFKKYRPTHIVHLAAGTGMDVKDISHFKTNFEGVKNIISASNAVDSVVKIVFTSSLLVCERTYSPKNDVDFKPDTLYGESKVLSEKIVRESNINSDWSIVRPTAVWGPWFRSSYTTFFKLVMKGYYFNPGKKILKKPATYVGNTIYMIDKILHSEESNNKVYYLADYPEYSIQEWAKSISFFAGKRNPFSFPRILILSIAKIGDILKFLKIFSDPPLTTFRLNNIISSTSYDLDKTKFIVGNLPYDLNSSVELTLNWLKNHSKE